MLEIDDLWINIDDKEVEYLIARGLDEEGVSTIVRGFLSQDRGPAPGLGGGNGTGHPGIGEKGCNDGDGAGAWCARARPPTEKWFPFHSEKLGYRELQFLTLRNFTGRRAMRAWLPMGRAALPLRFQIGRRPRSIAFAKSIFRWRTSILIPPNPPLAKGKTIRNCW